MKYMGTGWYNVPVELSEAVNSIAAFNGETIEETIKRHPKMASDNVYEDDESIVLLPKRDGENCGIYYIEKSRLDEDDWHDHLCGKGWIDTAMLAAFDKIQSEWLKKNKK